MSSSLSFVETRPADDAERSAWLSARRERFVAAATRWLGDGAAAETLVDERLAPFAANPNDTPARGSGAGDTSGRSEDGQAALVALIHAGVRVGVVATSISAGRPSTPASGQLDEVWIDPEHRRRGFGAAGLATGLQWLRERGFTRATATVDGADPAATALCRGGKPTAQRMYHYLSEDLPPLPTGFVIRPMTEAEFGPWQAASIDSYAQCFGEAGSLEPPAARERAVAGYAELLPDGLATEDQSIVVFEADAQAVGAGWLAHHRPGGRTFGYDLEVDSTQRGRGYGRAAMVAAEHLTRAAGDRSIGLNVFGFSEVARTLYERVGYQVADVTYEFPLS